MQEFLLFISFIFSSFIVSLILVWLYIQYGDKRVGFCTHHKPEHAHSSQKDIKYFECKKCGERSFKLAKKIEALHEDGGFINTAWLCGHDRCL